MVKSINLKSLAKNILIASLVAVCAALTFRLWFGGFGMQNLFSASSNVELSMGTNELTEMMIHPVRIIVKAEKSEGHNQANELGQIAEIEEFTQFNTMYAPSSENPHLILGMRIISEVLQNGQYDNSLNSGLEEFHSEFSWLVGGENEIIIFEYNFPMPADIFGEHFGQHQNMLSTRVSSFDMLVISHGKDMLLLAFTDRENMRIHYFSVENSLDFEVPETPETAVRYYLSTERFPDSFGSISFIPAWEDILYKNTIKPQAPYTDMRLNTIEPFVHFFFPNPGAMFSTTINNLFTYRDNFRTVKFYPNGVMMFSTMPSGRDTDNTVSFTDAYFAALNMVQLDIESMQSLGAPMNPIFLSGFQRVENENEWFFFFDYVSSNFPIVFSDDFATEIGMNHAIEIRVRNNIVVNYRRLLKNFYPDKNNNPESPSPAANRNFEIILGILPTIPGISEDLLHHAYLQYMLTSSDIGEIILHWCISFVNNTSFTIPAYFAESEVTDGY
ncbi:MAG: hypothetical protein FWD01_01325 [Defluviitaleaceae bacterium]|nr:hypothetical protein [Defluviitaleaceae bacterium]